MPGHIIADASASPPKADSCPRGQSGARVPTARPHPRLARLPAATPFRAGMFGESSCTPRREARASQSLLWPTAACPKETRRSGCPRNLAAPGVARRCTGADGTKHNAVSDLHADVTPSQHRHQAEHTEGLQFTSHGTRTAPAVGSTRTGTRTATDGDRSGDRSGDLRRPGTSFRQLSRQVAPTCALDPHQHHQRCPAQRRRHPWRADALNASRPPHAAAALAPPEGTSSCRVSPKRAALTRKRQRALGTSGRAPSATSCQTSDCQPMRLRHRLRPAAPRAVRGMHTHARAHARHQEARRSLSDPEVRDTSGPHVSLVCIRSVGEMCMCMYMLRHAAAHQVLRGAVVSTTVPEWRAVS